MSTKWIPSGTSLNTTQSLHLLVTVSQCNVDCTTHACHLPGTGSAVASTYKSMKHFCLMQLFNILYSLPWFSLAFRALMKGLCFIKSSPPPFFFCPKSAAVLFSCPLSSLFFGIYNCNSHLQLHKCKAGCLSEFSRICPHKITTLVITSLSKSKCSEQRLLLQPCYIRMPEDSMKGCIPVKHVFQNKKLFFFHMPWKNFISSPI